MRFEDIKEAVKKELVKTAGDKEKLYLRLEHENASNRALRSLGYTGLGGLTGAGVGMVFKKKPEIKLLAVPSGAIAGSIIAGKQNQAERVAELRQLLKIRDDVES